ncbi:EpsG family protein [Qipengyuania citrea]|uniref:EpsG family protein n=1 Tax=Qipengyuania citrea TaxID=225971 RepID=UPI00329859FA
MTFILPAYAALSLLALFGMRLEQRDARMFVRIAGWGAMGVVLLAVIFREIRGDTFRYQLAFRSLSLKNFSEVWAGTDNNWLFELLMWCLSQFGTDPLWFIMPITMFCIVMLRYSLRKLFGPTDTAIAIFLYSAYPFFIFYVGSGIKQALAMALLMHGYVCLFRKQRIIAILCFALAPLFHTGAVLVYPFLLLHYAFWRQAFRRGYVLVMSTTLLVVCTLLSVTGANQTMMAPVQEFASFADNYAIYFTDAKNVGYTAGFRLDFTLFSILPFAAAWWMRGIGKGLSFETSGWWLNLYALLACLYQLFAFAPFADRFASFGWYLIPTILVIMLSDTGAITPRKTIIAIFSLMNIAMLQFYTGPSLNISF